jgi:hypothetical protein
LTNILNINMSFSSVCSGFPCICIPLCISISLRDYFDALLMDNSISSLWWCLILHRLVRLYHQLPR